MWAIRVRSQDPNLAPILSAVPAKLIDRLNGTPVHMGWIKRGDNMKDFHVCFYDEEETPCLSISHNGYVTKLPSRSHCNSCPYCC